MIEGEDNIKTLVPSNPEYAELFSNKLYKKILDLLGDKAFEFLEKTSVGDVKIEKIDPGLENANFSIEYNWKDEKRKFFLNINGGIIPAEGIVKFDDLEVEEKSALVKFLNSL